MLKINTKKIRRTTLCVATALAISLPGTAMAGTGNKAKNPKPVVHLGNVVKKAGKKVAKAAKKGPAPLPGEELIEMVQQLNLVGQLQDAIAMMEQMNADYVYFAGGPSGCKGECKAFRQALKDTFDDVLDLIDEVPALSAKPGLFETIARVTDLIDVVPPQALYLLWQALDAQMDDMRMTANNIRDLLDALPPLDPMSSIGAFAGHMVAEAPDSPTCAWVKISGNFLNLVQAELERVAWIFTTAEGYIPDVEAEAEFGFEAGAAVANISGAASFSAQPTDAVKIALKVIPTIAETINWEIKLSILRAKVVCQVEKSVANFAAQ